jgi:hypothetical protein
MDVKTFEDMGKLQRRSIAVAHMLKSGVEVKNTENLIKKLVNSESGIKQLIEAHQEAVSAIQKIEDEINRYKISIETIVDLIGDILSDEQIKDFCLQYEPPVINGEKAQVIARDIDIAGCTSSKVANR